LVDLGWPTTPKGQLKEEEEKNYGWPLGVAKPAPNLPSMALVTLFSNFFFFFNDFSFLFLLGIATHVNFFIGVGMDFYKILDRS
jgi:hypothetical protein